MSSDLPTPSRGQRALAAIVVTDAVGFSARMSVDEENTLQLIQRDLTLMATRCQDFEGQVLKSTGDGLLMYFVSAVQAVSCAIAIQKSLTAQSRDTNDLPHRIGIHMGDVFFNNSDVMGNSVNIAARLQTQANPGGICLSKMIYDLVKVRLSLDADCAGPLQLKNIQEPITAYHINVAAGSKPKTAARSASGPQKTTSNPTSSQKPTPVLAEGTKVGGRYTIKRMLGQGGFGFSYLVEDTQRFGELCVLKELRPLQQQGKLLQKAIELFQREAKTLHSIDHPQIPKFMACFTQAKRLFIVQEYINGVTYLKLLQQRKKQSKLFSETEVTVWMAHMLRVLNYLHSLNIMHRDISPENVMYSRDRNLPVLIDFGLVNNTMSDSLSESVTHNENLQKAVTAVGKFGYSPPEQMFGKCTPSGDLYALGVTALVLLTGKHPRNLMDPHTLNMDWQQHAQISPALGKIIAKMTRQQPQNRFQSAQEVFEQLTPLLPVNFSKTLSQVPPPPAAISPEQTDRSSGPDPSFIAQCRDELSRCIGPIADMVIAETLEDYPSATPQEIVEILAGQISDADQATVFLSHICIPDEAMASSDTMPEITTVLQQRQQTLKPNFIDHCREVLAQCIGPMASMIIEDTLGDYPDLSPPAFVDRLAREIPDGEKAQEFRNELRDEISIKSK
ncbi:serine threonine protein kinase [Leptolyngbya sp. Heron Island J]|uniref:protein kinase domain-containing protein n=1 Tax=Leptolyngbya sp. Heron Island J TaxID=1385935 RepID=UPI0003B97AE2|nr:protein kinase [Leptolyngbya sp. Heron Island J]ESA36591.1 serine threonine protein kinase [Leptolyngbya sp. Heron Island J]